MPPFFRIVDPADLDLRGRACFLSTSIREIRLILFYFYFKILAMALRSLSTLINAREEVYVSPVWIFTYGNERGRTRLSSSASSVIRSRICVGVTDDLRNRIRKWQRWIVRVRIVFFTENNFVGFYDIISSLRSICPICHTLPRKTQTRRLNRMTRALVWFWSQSFLDEHVEFNKHTRV